LDFESIDVSKDRAKLEQMWANADNKKLLPQLHIANRLAATWEQLEALNERDGSQVKRLLLGEIEMPSEL
jgi:hypothetical protein